MNLPVVLGIATTVGIALKANANASMVGLVQIALSALALMTATAMGHACPTSAAAVIRVGLVMIVVKNCVTTTAINMEFVMEDNAIATQGTLVKLVKVGHAWHNVNYTAIVPMAHVCVKKVGKVQIVTYQLA